MSQSVSEILRIADEAGGPKRVRVNCEPLTEFSLLTDTELYRFWNDDHDFKMIVGPIGSGKTTMIVALLEHLICTIPPVTGGNVRETHGAVVRSHSNRLGLPASEWDKRFNERHGWKDGSVKTRRSQVLEARLKRDLPDGTRVEASVMFVGMNQPQHVEKIVGGNLTWVWANEVRNFDQRILNRIYQRTRRAPEGFNKLGGAWGGLMADTNPGGTNNWVSRQLVRRRRGLDSGSRMKVYLQPPAGWYNPETGFWDFNKRAENLENLPQDYYENSVTPEDHGENLRNIAMEPVDDRTGGLVWPSFDQQYHVREFTPMLGGAVIAGQDFGLDGAVVFGEVYLDEKENRPVVRIIDEVIQPDTDKAVINLMEEAIGRMNQWKEAKRTTEDRIYSDPTGDNRDGRYGDTTVEWLESQFGWRCLSASSNALNIRLSTVKKLLDGRTLENTPRLVIHPRCRKLVQSLTSGYVYQAKAASEEGRQVFEEIPRKDEHSHRCDALQYMCMGALEDVGFGWYSTGSSIVQNNGHSGMPVSMSRRDRAPNF